MMTNSGPADMRINSTVIRMTHGTALLPAGTNTVTFSYVNDGQSIIPRSFPPTNSPTFSYTAAARQWQVSTGTAIYQNATCAGPPNEAPVVLPGQTVKLGRFALTMVSNSNGNNAFVAGASAQLAFAPTAAMIVYLNCNSVTSLSSALTKTLITPCALTVPSAGCTIAASIQSQINTLCFGETGSATATSTGGTAPVTYSWNTSPVQTGATATGLQPGSYIVTATGADACSATATAVITGPTAALVASAVQDAPILCNGGTTSVTVSATGGTSPYLGTGTFTVSAGTHNYTITDANNCTTNTSVTVSEPDALTATGSSTDASTPSATDGTVTANVSGGTAPYTIIWNTTPTQTGPTATGLGVGFYTANITDDNGCVTTASATVSSPSCALLASSSQGPAILCFGGTTTVTVSQTGGVEPVTGTGAFTVGAGSYSFTVTDNNGCSSTTNITVSEPSAVAITPSFLPILCNGGTTAVTITGSGGTPPYSGEGTFNQTVGSDTYIVTDANGCTASTTVTLTEPTAVVASSSATAIACFGGSSTVTVSATGGTAPYTGTGTFTEVAGTYTYTVTDANGCTATTTVTITEPSELVASSSATAIGCFGGSSTVTVSATGGTAPYTGTGSFTEVAGTYTYTVSDANGCTATTTITITQPALLTASSSATAILCNGGESTVTVTAAGGTPTYIGVGTFTVLAGTYTYNVSDLNGCTASTTITVTEPTALAATATSTPASCPTCADGTVSIASVTGGTSPYSSTNLTGLLPGNYCITVTDANGCTTSACATVNTAACSIVASSVQDGPILCNGGTTTITVSQTGGALPVTGTGTFTVSAGPYSFTVTDANGCSSTTTGTVSEPTVLSASSSQDAAILCNGGTTTITVSATGGTTPYSGTGTFTVSAGSYSFTVTDANGCTSTTTGTVTEPSAVVASSSSTAILCNGGSSTVTVSATGGTAPYSGTGTFTETAGTYTYTVTDANGCTATTTITITEPAALVASSSATAILCNGGSSTVTVSATGGTAPYTGTGFFNETAGTYTYTVTDANGCSATTTITITEPAVLVASSSFTPILCNGGSSTITVSATGGTAPYSGTGTFTLGGGSWTFTVTDANGCESSTSIFITEPSQLEATAFATGSILCFGGTTTVSVNASGGTAPYSGTGTFNQAAGTITYTVTDANGCTSSSSVTLTQPTKVEGTTSTTPASGCSTPDGTATVVASGGNGSYTYVWSPGGQTTATATGLVAGSYTVSITDGNGCSGSATALVTGSGGSVGTPSAISGPAGACRNSAGIVYSVINDPNATSYTWTLPSGATGSSTTNSITVAFGSGFNGGFICVAANNACGSSMTSCLNIPVIVAYPSLPAVISGPSVTCGAGVYTFSTSSANATSYNWTVTGTGVFIASGQGTNTITVSVPVNFAQGSVQVRGVNCNGISAVRGMTITGIPAHSNAVSGPTKVCANGTATYSMPVVPGVDTYTWSITGDASLDGQNLTSTTSSATFNFGPAWTSGQVSITVSNTCGSYTRSFTVGSVPNQPGGITGPGTALCNLSGVTYSIVAVPGATSYNWSVPAGVNIVSTAPNGLSIVVNFTAAFTTNAGNICVSANNACGAGPARCFTVTSRPAVPVITGPTSVCKTQSNVSYNLAPITGATSYTWSVTGGASIAPSGTTAIVNFNTALTSSAVVRANAVNACGASQPAALAVSVNQFCRTAADNASINTAEFSVYPNPTSAKTTVSFNSDSDMKYTVKVADLLGNIIYSNVIDASENYNSTEINMTDFAKGVYVISVTSEDGNSQSKRVVVE